MMRHRACAACTLAIVLSLAGAPGGAQTARSGGGANAQALAQMQQLAAERTTLQAENAKLKKDLEEARKDRDALKKEHQALDQRARTSEASLKQSQAGRQSLEQELARTKEQTQQLVA